MRKLLGLVLVVGLTFVSGCSEEIPITVPYKVVGYHAGKSSAFGTIFAYVDLTGVTNDVGYRDLQKISRKLCYGKNVCFVHFWDKEENAARAIPMSDKQVKTMIASYNINQNPGNDRFQCHPFFGPGERCN